MFYHLFSILQLFKSVNLIFQKPFFMKYTCSLIAFLVLSFCTNDFIYAQEIQVPQNALLKNLLRDSTSVAHISISHTSIIPQPADFAKNFQQLVKTQNSLYIFIDGTGRVYKASKWDDQKVSFSRVDSTIYFGYNQGARKLIINDTIFSYGGYGFWHFNGCLSYFTSHKDWEMQPLNMDIPFFNINNRYSSIVFFDTKNQTLYFSAAPIVQQTVVHGLENDSFYILNIANRNLITLGKNLFHKAKFEKFRVAKQIETPYGILFDCPLDDNRDYILNIKNNEVYTSDSRIIQSLIPSADYASDNILFYKKGYIYASTSPFDKIDSLKIEFNKFNKLDNKIFVPVNTSNLTQGIQKNKLLLISVFLILSVILAYLLYILFFQKRNVNQQIEKSNDHQELLSSLEKQLLKEFISMVEVKGICSTEELNSLLGVGYKSIEVKKKARTDFITKVNFKLRTHFSTQSDIIIRDRSDLDKRSYLYSIEKDMIPNIKKLLK